jgi:hypothetical protein
VKPIVFVLNNSGYWRNRWLRLAVESVPGERVGHTDASGPQPLRVGPIDRGIHRHSPWGDTRGLLPKSFAIYRWVV